MKVKCDVFEWENGKFLQDIIQFFFCLPACLAESDPVASDLQASFKIILQCETP